MNEIIDALYPYFAGASLGWHDYLSSTARLFKEDGNYRIPVKADPNIVIKYIKASHDLLAQVVGPRGGVKIGGMYGVLPMDGNLTSPSFQVTMKGFIKDVLTQMKRDLSGFWVAHPDFVRIGLALVEGWKCLLQGERHRLEELVTALLAPQSHEEILKFVRGPDLQGLNVDHPLYARSLLVADTKESTFIANNHPDEIRYNVFQSLQYLTDWLSGNGCVALPAQIDGVAVRVMDDLATAERSRWEVWHELRHHRFALRDFLKIAHEEMLFIRKDFSNDKKIVQVKWDERTEKWYPVAFKLMLQLMTTETPVEFATELLLPFTVSSIRQAANPWSEVLKSDGRKYRLDPYIERFNKFFGACGSLDFADAMAGDLDVDLAKGEQLVNSLNDKEVLAAASFHGDIGESKKTLDETASREQAQVLKEADAAVQKLRSLGTSYKEKFGVKFLISAQGKSANEILLGLEKRLENPKAQEWKTARSELWEITRKRLIASDGTLQDKISLLLKKHKIVGAQIAVNTGSAHPQTLCFGESQRGKKPVSPRTQFELASLSKTVASAYALDYFRDKNIPLSTKVNELFAQAGSTYRIPDDGSGFGNQVELTHLMNHSALNMHYVNGIPATDPMPNVKELLNGHPAHGYSRILAIHAPGTTFAYSGGGFLVLEHLLECLEKKSIQQQTAPFFAKLGIRGLTFNQKTVPDVDYASGYLSDGSEVAGQRKMFPALAAGAMGTAMATGEFLVQLTRSFRSLFQEDPLSHATSVTMLRSTSTMSRGFMGADIGLGVFTVDAGPNRLALHQGANDGFRSLFVHCYDGPDAGRGMVLFCNGDENGVLFIAEAAQLILRELNLQGVDLKCVANAFDTAGIPQEQIVNQAYRSLIFKAFQPDLPESIGNKGPKDPFADFNVAVGAEILEVTNQGFARAENLLSAQIPVFEPELFGRQGKIMDSWETVRHNPRPCDVMIFELAKPSAISYISLSTQFHLGNQAPFVQLEARESDGHPWVSLLAKLELEGHALKKVTSADSKTVFKQIRVSLFPDGGLTRLGLYGENLPAMEKKNFADPRNVKSIPFADPIPKSTKPLSPNYEATPEEVERNWAALAKGAPVDLASSAFGGKILSVTNEHFGPAAQVISPFPPVNMFDGFESARSREKDHSEEVVVSLGREARVAKVLLDFTYFRNNNPREVSVQALVLGEWRTVIAKTPVKAYAGNIAEFKVNCVEPISQVKVTVFPDGGINRVHVFGVNG